MESRTRRERVKHSKLYNTDRFLNCDLTRQEIYGLPNPDRKDYIALHFKGEKHDCYTCIVTHLVGGWCSEGEEEVPDPRPSSKMSRTNRRQIKNR